MKPASNSTPTLETPAPLCRLRPGQTVTRLSHVTFGTMIVISVMGPSSRPRWQSTERSGELTLSVILPGDEACSVGTLAGPGRSVANTCARTTLRQFQSASDSMIVYEGVRHFV